MQPMRLAVFTAWLLAGGGMVPPAGACTVPVFRYALERWEPELYPAYVFHRGALTPEQEQRLRQLTHTPEGLDRPLNLEIERVDLGQTQPPAVQALFQRAGSNALPWLVVLVPDREHSGPPAQADFSERRVAWSGPLTAEALARLADSPARREIGRRLLRGDAAVWVLIESNDSAKDAAAAKQLADELPKLEQDLALSSEAADSADLRASYFTNVPLRVAFSTLRLSLRDPQEEVLARLLQEVFPAAGTQPAVLPVFGRGRALVEFLPAPLTAKNLADAAAFLVGACSCQTKELNPGLDLLMAAHWEDILAGALTVEHALPPLTGVLPQPRSSSLPETQDDRRAPSAPALPPRRSAPPGPLRRNAVLLLVLTLGVLGIGTVILLRRTPRP
jgi:hypothetical protein